MNASKVLGATMGLCGVALWGLGGFVMWRAVDPDHQTLERNAKITQQCVSQVSAIGKASRREDGSVDVELPEVQDARNTLGDLTTILAMCPYQVVTHACIGVKCGAKPSQIPVATIRLGPPRTVRGAP